MIRELTKFKGSDKNMIGPLQINHYGTANNVSRRAVVFAFSSGDMAAALEIPAKDVEFLCAALTDSARKALEGEDEGEEKAN